jgi:hypothetical protein
MSLVFLDTETTGLDPALHEVWEIAWAGMSLKFSPKAHRYWLDGKPIPGVTTLLGKGLPKPAIPYWAAKTVAEFVVDNPEQVDQIRSLGRGPAVAALKAIPWQAATRPPCAAPTCTSSPRRSSTAARSTSPTTCCPTWRATPVAGRLRREADPHRAPVASRSLWYAGTFDAIVEIGGVRWLLDWKTSKGVYGSTALQCAAYAGAEFYQDEDGEEQPIPEVERIGVVHITEAGTALRPFKDRDAAWKCWRHVQWVASQIPAIDDQLEDALEAPETNGAAA